MINKRKTKYCIFRLFKDHHKSIAPTALLYLETNLARQVTDTRQSATGLNMTADRAVDGDTRTCAVIDRTRSQRWWQLKLENKIKLKAVRLHMKRGDVTTLCIDYDELYVICYP